MKKTIFQRPLAYIKAHKFITTIIVIIVIGGLYYWYHTATAGNVTPQYAIARVRVGDITQTVTGTGQVSSQNQIDVKSTVSGSITSIPVIVGQHVHTGDLLATVDSSQAALDLQTARISFEKFTQPAKPADISNAQNNLTKSYNDEYNAMSSTFLDLPSIMSGMKDMLYTRGTYLNDADATQLTSTGRVYRDTFGSEYDSLALKYTDIVQKYSTINQKSATSSIDQLATLTYGFLKQVADTLHAGQNAINFIATSQPDYKTSLSTSAAANIKTWSNQINSDLTSVLSAQNSIQSNTNALNTLITGADPLDVQSQQISLSQKEKSYSDYFIRAPFDGVVGRISVNKYDQASGATIATIIGDNKVATISLNEIDAAKVQAGQPATITFDAINSFTATGTVSQVDLVGTVTQGVVTYGVKISINSDDPRIKPGMSVNTTIITKQLTGVMVVPSSAIKTQGQRQYVQIFDNPTLPIASSTNRFASSTLSSTTRANFRNQFGDASSTSGVTGANGFTGNGGGMRATTAVTISSITAPRDQFVTIGDADDTNTEILGGVTVGQWIVTRTITSGQTTATAPSILNTLGGNARGGASGTARVGGAATLGR